MTYGILDTKDNVWIGNNDGPILYKQEEIAKLAAQVFGVRLGFAPGRTKATEYTNDATKKRDELIPKRSGEEALRLLEEGKIL